MGWSVGYDKKWERWIGYGVPAYCDHPECSEEIDRGLAYVCSHEEPYGGHGCGLYFCHNHTDNEHQCGPCRKGEKPFPKKADHPDWVHHQATHPSWAKWRAEQAEAAK